MAQTDIITRLQQDILRMQGQRAAKDSLSGKVALGPVLEAFPNKIFPMGVYMNISTLLPRLPQGTGR